MDLSAVEDFLDKKFEQIESDSQKIKANSEMSLIQIRSFLDRWDGIRASVFQAGVKVTRKWRDAKAEYDDNMRRCMTKRSMRDSAHYDERKASYELTNLGYYKALRQWERAKDEIDMFLRYLGGKEKWLDAIRFEKLAEDKKEQYASTREYLSHDN